LLGKYNECRYSFEKEITNTGGYRKKVEDIMLKERESHAKLHKLQQELETLSGEYNRDKKVLADTERSLESLKIELNKLREEKQNLVMENEMHKKLSKNLESDKNKLVNELTKTSLSFENNANSNIKTVSSIQMQ